MRHQITMPEQRTRLKMSLGLPVARVILAILPDGGPKEMNAVRKTLVKFMKLGLNPRAYRRNVHAEVCDAYFHVIVGNAPSGEVK